MDPVDAVAALVAAAISNAVGPDVAGDPMVRRSDRADLQCDAAPALAGKLRQNPRVIAAQIVAALPANDIVERTEIAGAGFLNITLRTAWLAEVATRAHADDRLGVPLASTPERVVIDYSAPNIAKEMHVGHMRSTIIGDCLARVLAWRGHTVIRQNHLGDWGTPFGMLIEHLVDLGDVAAERELAIGETGVFYRAANKKFETDPAFADRARARVVALQAGDPSTLERWRTLIDLSTRYCETVYAALDVKLVPSDICAESFYNDRLAPLVAEVDAAGRIEISGGAGCLFPAGFTNREGGPLPLILRKSDGGYGYATTDLAAIHYRIRELRATRLLYVVGASQARHLSMIFTAATELGWVTPAVRVQHVAFGFVLGDDGKPLKSREGRVFKLVDLIEDAIARADQVLGERENTERALEPEQRREVARMVGVGAIKYADLANDRIKDYTFDLERMVSFRGDTAGYLQYAHARVNGVFRDRGDGAAVGPIALESPEERTLAFRLLGFATAVRAVETTLEPHRLAAFLHDIATAFTKFYDACPVLTSTGETRASRLALTNLTGRTLGRGLDLLGIAAPDRM
ncbi:MAG: arginine--tRNA ligase [Kofleriaceae bacterium]